MKDRMPPLAETPWAAQGCGGTCYLRYNNTMPARLPPWPRTRRWCLMMNAARTPPPITDLPGLEPL